ncbi:MAG: serine/threonine-protein phosphatase, partial [Ruminococcus sp.]|nr:serine/threonine-protein phosphatase [Ruminococcus sp.]
GDYASYISAKTAKRLYTSLKEGDGAPVAEQIAQYVQNANDQIRDFLEENNCRSGGSTVCAVIIRDGVVYPFSLGDSRIYLLDPDGMVQLSKDQTLAMKKYEANIYTLEEAENSVDSHKLTAFLGVDYYREGLAPQLYDTFAWQPQDRILLCSDGLYGELTNDVIQSIIREYPDNPTLELVRAALKNGGRDNVTCVLIERVE